MSEREDVVEWLRASVIADRVMRNEMRPIGEGMRFQETLNIALADELTTLRARLAALEAKIGSTANE